MPLHPLDIRHLLIRPADGHPTGANGIHYVARNLAREQIHAGDHARLLVLQQCSRSSGPDIVDVPLTVLPLAGRKIRRHALALDQEILDAIVAGAGPRTIFHIHESRNPLLVWLTHEFRKRNIPYGLTIHGRYSHLGQEGERSHAMLRVYLALLERRVLEQARFVHAVSAEERTIVRRIAPNAVIAVVPNAAFSSALDVLPLPPVRLSRRRDFPVFGYCGRYAVQHKGLDLLLQGFALHARNGGAGRLVLVGSGPAREQLRAEVGSLGLADRVEVHGPKFGAEKALIHQQWDFFVQPSRYDGMPIGAIEAALMGLPLIVTSTTGLHEALRRHGAGIPIRETNNAAEVAAAFQIAAGMSHDGWSAMSRQAFAMGRQIGDWTSTAARLRELYCRIR